MSGTWADINYGVPLRPTLTGGPVPSRSICSKPHLSRAIASMRLESGPRGPAACPIGSELLEGPDYGGPLSRVDDPGTINGRGGLGDLEGGPGTDELQRPRRREWPYPVGLPPGQAASRPIATPKNGSDAGMRDKPRPGPRQVGHLAPVGELKSEPEEAWRESAVGDLLWGNNQVLTRAGFVRWGQGPQADDQVKFEAGRIGSPPAQSDDYRL